MLSGHADRVTGLKINNCLKIKVTRKVKQRFKINGKPSCCKTVTLGGHMILL